MVFIDGSMKTSRVPTDYVSGSGADSEPPQESGVQAAIRAIDTAPLDQLLDIRKEQARLTEYRTRAEALKGKVEAAVWKRVVDDYMRRAKSFDDQGAPLKVQVRAEYQKLRALFEQIRSDNEAARLEKEELELRHAVGELSDEDLAERLKAPNQVLDQCRGDLVAVDEQKARFLSAFESEADLEAGVPPAKATRETAAAQTADPESVESTTKLTSDSGEDAHDLKTVLVPELAPDAEAAVTTDRPSRDDEGATFLLPLAALIVGGINSTTTEHRLAALNYLGRSEDNQIQIARPGVSRRHALIVATPSGFTIKDLQSQNGTFVNGDRVTERPLVDGDCILIGNAELTFRSPWPVPARP
jgi:hypothetical protein